MAKPIYKRILLKLSGEALMGSSDYWIHPATAKTIADNVARVIQSGMQVGIVIGGGNIFRGSSHVAANMDRSHADQIGMLATIINSLSLQHLIREAGQACHVMSALGGTEIVQPFVLEKALKYLDKGEAVIFAGGTGNPFFTTDTCASLRAAQIKAQALLKATKVDGVYDKDPIKFSDAKRFDEISFQEVIEKNLGVMDITAVSMCKENKIPVKVFSIDSMWEAVTKPRYGTLVT